MTSTEITEFVSLVSGIGLDGLSSLVPLFMYQGFNPEMVLKHFLEIKKSKGILDGEFQSDMLTLICLGVMSGNYTSNNKNKIDDKGRDKADALFTKYQMKIGSVGQDKKAVTLPRVLATFPILTSNVAMSDTCPEKNYPGGFFASENLPKALKTPVFPALIPAKAKDDIKKFLMIACCCYSADQSKAINPAHKAADAKTIYQEQWQYVEISHQSSQPTQSMREIHIKTMKLEYTDIVKVVEKYKSLVDPSYEIPTKESMKGISN